jgi:hypothetical protein
MSAVEGRADMPVQRGHFRLCPLNGPRPVGSVYELGDPKTLDIGVAGTRSEVTDRQAILDVAISQIEATSSLCACKGASCVSSLSNLGAVRF